MKIYTINKHWRVVETVDVIAETEQEAIELSKDKHSNNLEYIEITDACVTDTKEVKASLDNIVSDAEDYIKSLEEPIEFYSSEELVAEYSGLYDYDEQIKTCTVTGASYHAFEIQVICDDNFEVPLSCFSEADQYRICEIIIEHRDDD